MVSPERKSKLKLKGGQSFSTPRMVGSVLKRGRQKMKVRTAAFQLIIASMIMMRKRPKTTVLSEFCDWER